MTWPGPADDPPDAGGLDGVVERRRVAAGGIGGAGGRPGVGEQLLERRAGVGRQEQQRAGRADGAGCAGEAFAEVAQERGQRVLVGAVERDGQERRRAGRCRGAGRAPAGRARPRRRRAAPRPARPRPSRRWPALRAGGAAAGATRCGPPPAASRGPAARAARRSRGRPARSPRAATVSAGSSTRCSASSWGSSSPRSVRDSSCTPIGGANRSGSTSSQRGAGRQPGGLARAVQEARRRLVGGQLERLGKERQRRGDPLLLGAALGGLDPRGSQRRERLDGREHLGREGPAPLGVQHQHPEHPAGRRRQRNRGHGLVVDAAEIGVDEVARVVLGILVQCRRGPVEHRPARQAVADLERVAVDPALVVRRRGAQPEAAAGGVEQEDLGRVGAGHGDRAVDQRGQRRAGVGRGGEAEGQILGRRVHAAHPTP